MSAPYERVRKALEGTAMAGDLDRLNAELHLTPESPEWVIAALAMIGAVGLQRDLREVERRLTRLPETLADGMRASGAEIVRGLGDEIAGTTTDAVKRDTLAMLQQAANIMADHVGGLVEDVRKATLESTASLSADVATTSSAMTAASTALAHGVAKLGGWTAESIATTAVGVALGAMLGIGMFFTGATVRSYNDTRACTHRTDRVANALHLTPHGRNALQRALCQE